MIHIANITDRTAKSADHLGNAGFCSARFVILIPRAFASSSMRFAIALGSYPPLTVCRPSALLFFAILHQVGVIWQGGRWCPKTDSNRRPIAYELFFYFTSWGCTSPYAVTSSITTHWTGSPFSSRVVGCGRNPPHRVSPHFHTMALLNRQRPTKSQTVLQLAGPHPTPSTRPQASGWVGHLGLSPLGTNTIPS